MVELLSPCQDFTTLQAAIQGGCDAVYFGVKSFNMRAGARNFEIKDLSKISKVCKKNNVKAYLTLNTVVYDKELKKIGKIVAKAKKAGIDAIICWDTAVIQICKKNKIPIHISTQASVSNFEAVKYYHKLGAEQIVLARELSLKQISDIIKQIKKAKLKIGIETFIHGAMCVSVSGRCFLSQFSFDKSANRGECIQNCRRAYTVKDVDNETELELHNNYILSAKDLCCLPFLDKLVKSGISSFKIEGRNRSPEYVKTVTDVYRKSLDLINAKKFTKSNINLLEKELKTVYNRSFSSGFYLGQPLNEWAKTGGNISKVRKVYIGKVSKFYKKISVFEIELVTGQIKKGDSLIIQGPTTGCIKFIVKEMQIKHKSVSKVKKGQKVAIKSPTLLRKSDEVYIVKKTKG